MDNGHWPYDSSPPPREHRDGWVVAGGDPADLPPQRHQGGDGAPNGGPYNGAHHPGGEPAQPTWPAGTPYNGAGYGSREPAEQTWAGGWYAEPREQPRHVGRYPVRSYPAGPYPPGTRATAPARPGRAATASASVPVRASARAPVEEPADPPRTRLSAVLWTVGFYLIPIAVYLLWAVTLSGEPPVGCVGEDGGPCPPPRTAALANLAGSALGLAGALFASLVLSLGLARLAGDWRGFTVGFAASVIGAGSVTLFISAIR